MNCRECCGVVLSLHELVKMVFNVKAVKFMKQLQLFHGPQSNLVFPTTVPIMPDCRQKKSVAILGSSGSSKSTLGGRFLNECGAVGDYNFKKLQESADAAGKSSEVYAFIMDCGGGLCQS